MSAFKFNAKNFASIVLASRRGFTKEMAQKGKTVLVTIQGNGNTIDVKNKDGEAVASASGTGEQLQKRIFNTFANSGVAMSNPQNVAMFKAAKAAEKAGETDKAHELYAELANKFQVSFGVLFGGKGDKIINALSDNTEISAKLQLIETEKGSIITIDPKTIRVMEPEVVEAMSLPSSYLDDEEETVDADAVLAEA